MQWIIIQEITVGNLSTVNTVYAAQVQSVQDRIIKYISDYGYNIFGINYIIQYNAHHKYIPRENFDFTINWNFVYKNSPIILLCCQACTVQLLCTKLVLETKDNTRSFMHSFLRTVFTATRLSTDILYTRMHYILVTVLICANHR